MSDVRVALGPRAESKFTHQEGDGEPDPGEQGEAADVAPCQAFVEFARELVERIPTM